MAEQVKLCPHCGAKMMEYRHRLSKPLVRALFKALRAGRGRPVHLKDSSLTYSERCNFQKLRYFGLAEGSEEKAGVWKITKHGHLFIFGEVKSPSAAITYRGAIVRFEGPEVAFGDVTGLYYTRAQYAAEATPHDDH